MKSVWARVLPFLVQGLFLKPWFKLLLPNYSVTLGKELNLSQDFQSAKRWEQWESVLRMTWAFRVRAARDLWGSTLWKYYTEEVKSLRIKLLGVQFN